MERRNVLSKFSDVVHAVESNKRRRNHFLVACAGAVSTLVLWWAHLSRPAIFGDAFLHGRVSPMWLAIFLAPPFMMTFGLASVFSKPPSNGQDTGPMSGYLSQQESNKQWKIRVGSCIAAVANLLLMFVSARPV
jgi:hypothetical protein